MTRLALQMRGGKQAMGAGKLCVLCFSSSEEGLFLCPFPASSPTKKYSCFSSCMLREVGEVRGGDLELLACTLPPRHQLPES